MWLAKLASCIVANEALAGEVTSYTTLAIHREVPGNKDSCTELNF